MKSLHRYIFLMHESFQFKMYEIGVPFNTIRASSPIHFGEGGGCSNLKLELIHVETEKKKKNKRPS